MPTYVGTDACKRCHAAAYDVWEKSKHSHAYASLVKKTQPSLRQYDAECIVCHTVGFGYESGFKSEKETPLLKNVGCESCHGPASEHVKSQRGGDEQKKQLGGRCLIRGRRSRARRPQKEQRQLRIDKFCAECHDIDNDVHFKFEKAWPAIAHPSFVE